MIELRYIKRETGKRLMNEWGYYYPETNTILQYRCRISSTDYSSIDQVKINEWSDWIDVPVIE